MMSADPAASPPAPKAPRLLRAASLGCLIAALAVVLVTTLCGPLKDDIAWLLYVADQWLQGRHLYVDLVEVNPPLIVWLCAVPVYCAHLLHIAPKLVAMPAFCGIVLLCAWITAGRLRSQGGAFADRPTVFAVIGCVLLLIPGAEFGQREHLLAAMALPYLALVSAELCGRPTPALRAALIGILAAIGCALKPRYVLAFGLVELFAVAQGLRLLRPVNVAAAATLGLYLLAVLAFTPTFFSEAVPMAFALYGATDVPFLGMLVECRVLLLGLLAAVCLWASHPDRPDATRRLGAGLVFAAGAALVCVIQGKNWFYHQLPGTLSTVLCLLGLIRLRIGPGWRWDARRLAPAALALVALLAFGLRAYDRLHPQIGLAWQGEDATQARLAALIRREKARSYVAFSEWIGLGFPVVNNTGVVWASRFDSMWPLHGMRGGHPPPGTELGTWHVADWVVSDFLRICPDLVAVDWRESADYVAYLSENESAFRRAWTLYRPIAAFNHLVVFRNSADAAHRAAAGCGTAVEARASGP
jgi:hypothetical protein